MIKKLILPFFLMLTLIPLWGCAEFFDLLDYAAETNDILTGREAKEEAREEKKREEKKQKKAQAAEKHRQEAEQARKERELEENMASCLRANRSQATCDLLYKK